MPHPLSRPLACLTAAACLALSGPLRAAQETPTGDVAAALDAWFGSVHEDGLFNGVVLARKAGETVYERAWGRADLRDERPLQVDTPFYLASVSKQFTCMAALILVERGQLDLDDRLVASFPEFAGFADDVRVHHLMTHTSGLPDHFRLLGGVPAGLTNAQVQDLLVEHGALDFAPGTDRRYSNGAYVMLSRLVGRVADQPFGDFLRAAVLEPLGMTRTTVWDERRPDVGERAVGFARSGALDDYELFTTGAGGMFTTVGDLARWDAALADGALIGPDLYARAFTPLVLPDGRDTGYGFGWGIAQGGRILHHSGGLNGFATLYVRDHQADDAVIVLCNQPPAMDLYDVADAVRAVLDGRPARQPVVSVAEVVRRLIREQGVEAALRRYDAIRADPDGRYDLDESRLNALGYEYVAAGQLETAQAVLAKNCEVYPEAYNTWDSLAEVEALLGRRELAVEHYRRSLELNPDNEHAVEELARLER